MKERWGWIYVLHCLVNDKEYVGQTIQKYAEYRWDAHAYSAFVRMDRRPLYSAIRKYGLENFTAEVLWHGPESGLNAAERRFIRQRKTFIDGGWGYNLTTGGGVHQVSKRTICKLQQAARARVEQHPTWFQHLVSLMLDKAHTRIAAERRIQTMLAYAENRRAAGKPYFSRRVTILLRTSATGRRHTDSAKQKMSIGQAKRWAEGRGQVCTETLRAKRSKSARLQWKTKREEMLASIHKAVSTMEYSSKRSKLAKLQWARMHNEMCASLRGVPKRSKQKFIGTVAPQLESRAA